MNNPFSVLGNGNGGGRMPAPFGDFQQMMQQFQQFKSTFHGDPKAEVEKLLQSGRINQQQLDMVQGLARQFQSFLQ